MSVSSPKDDNLLEVRNPAFYIFLYISPNTLNFARSTALNLSLLESIVT